MKNLEARLLRSRGGFLCCPLLLIAPYKAGSTWMFISARAICRLLNASYVNYPQYIWERGGDLLQSYYHSSDADAMLSEPLVYLGNRQAIDAMSQTARAKSASMVMLRDPRDCLVSMYFSFLGSHAAPRHASKSARTKLSENRGKSGSWPSIDSYVLSKAEWYHSLMKDTLSFAHQNNATTIIKYEDYIHDKLRFCRWIYSNITDLASGNSQNMQTQGRRRAASYLPACLHGVFLKLIAMSTDRIPSSERPNSHVRKATPGDHVSKLNKSTIAKLDDVFHDVLSIM
jgi:hypothetical protein